MMAIDLRIEATFRRGEATIAASIVKAFHECSPEMQAGIGEMIEIIYDDKADQEDVDAALATLFEALFPHAASDICDDDDRAFETSEFKEADRELDREQEEFAQRVRDQMQLKGVTEAQLAHDVGITPSAVANILNRKVRPQRRTVAGFATALQVQPDELWPTFTNSANQ